MGRMTNMRELIGIAQALVAGDKVLLAMDESNPTGNTRFARLRIPQAEEARRASNLEANALGMALHAAWCRRPVWSPFEGG